MQKKFLTLAVATVISNISAVAVAETNVQIYGIVDYGYTLRHDRIKAAKEVGYSQTNSRFDSGQSAGNRLGFKGEEDLGNGVKALFVLERGFFLDTGGDAISYQGLGGFNRQAYVGLSGNFGTIVGGLVYTPYYKMVSSLDPFADGTVGNYHNVKEDLGSDLLGNFLYFDPIRVSNAIAYVSPSWGGLNFTALYSNSPWADESGIRNASSPNVYAIAGNYVADNWNVGLNYHYIAGPKTANQPRILKGVHNITLGGAYDFKAVKVSAFISYDKASFKDNFAVLNNKKSYSQTNFMLGAIAPFGKHAVKGSFNYSHNNKNQYGNAWQLAI